MAVSIMYGFGSALIYNGNIFTKTYSTNNSIFSIVIDHKMKSIEIKLFSCFMFFDTFIWLEIKIARFHLLIVYKQTSGDGKGR